MSKWESGVSYDCPILQSKKELRSIDPDERIVIGDDLHAKLDRLLGRGLDRMDLNRRFHVAPFNPDEIPNDPYGR